MEDARVGAKPRHSHSAADASLQRSELARSANCGHGKLTSLIHRPILSPPQLRLGKEIIGNWHDTANTRANRSASPVPHAGRLSRTSAAEARSRTNSSAPGGPHDDC